MPLSSKTKANDPFTVARTPPFSTSRDHCTLLTDIKVSFAITDVSTAVQKEFSHNTQSWHLIQMHQTIFKE